MVDLKDVQLGAVVKYRDLSGDIRTIVGFGVNPEDWSPVVFLQLQYCASTLSVPVAYLDRYDLVSAPPADAPPLPPGPWARLAEGTR